LIALTGLGALYQQNKILNTINFFPISIKSSNTRTIAIDKAATRTIALESNAEHIGRGGVKGIAWLMSYPNSGTSYTLFLTSTITGTTTATASNYVQRGNNRNVKKKNLAEYEGVFSDYPVPHWSLQDVNVNIQNPTAGYVLTKTHCGGYCFGCFAGSDSVKLKNSEDFFKSCRKGHYVSQNMTSGQLDILDSCFIFGSGRQDTYSVLCFRCLFSCCVNL